MFGFLRKTPPAIGSLDVLGVDMHAHWLPGLDDGAKDMEESLQLIRRLVAMGYRKLIATPHVMADIYPNSAASIRGSLEQVRRAVTTAGIDVELDAAAEYLLDEGFVRLLEKDELLTLPGNHVLVEFSFVSPPPTRDELFFAIQAKGYWPILAHPERYHYYHNRLEEYSALHRRGTKLQVNLLSLLGHYGKEVKQVALYLINEGLADILGTDAHHAKHLAQLQFLIDHKRYSRPLSTHNWRNEEIFA